MRILRSSQKKKQKAYLQKNINSRIIFELIMHKLQIVELIMLMLQNLLVELLVMITFTGKLTC